jgi:hypothetical protein
VGGSIVTARRYAAIARAALRRLRWPAGSAPNWQNHRFPNSTSFVVELPAGQLERAVVERCAHAVMALP